MVFLLPSISFIDIIGINILIILNPDNQYDVPIFLSYLIKFFRVFEDYITIIFKTNLSNKRIGTEFIYR